MGDDNALNYYGTPVSKVRTSKSTPTVLTLREKDGIQNRGIITDGINCLCNWLWGPLIMVVLIIITSLTFRAVLDHDTNQQNYSSLLNIVRSELISTKDLVFESLSPKINLINTMASYTIPSLLTSMRAEIIEEVLKKQTPVFEYKNNTCPVVQSPTHSPQFQEFDQDIITRCVARGMQIGLSGTFDLQEVPSFIPGQTTSRGCTRIPSFSLSPFIWAYTHNVIRQGCSDSGMSDQYLAIGVISEGGGRAPIFETLATWYTDDEINRKSCTVAAGDSGAWMGCNIVTENERDDVRTPGINSIFLSYIDIFSRKRYWIYTETQLVINRLFTYLTFAVGSGVVVNDKVYLPMYGSLANDQGIDCFCYAPECGIFNMTLCNQGCRPTWLANKVFVTVIMIFNNNPTVRPVPTFVIINPRSGWMGSEARLIHNFNHGTTYIYSRSSTWHALPQVGLINLDNLSQVLWVTHLGIGRPSQDPCPATHRCPRDCIGGVYNDIFPLGRYYEFGITVYLNDDRTRVNPTISLLNVTRSIHDSVLTRTTQRADYSTTTCFIFKGKPWCLSIVEIRPSAIGEVVPIPFTYTLPLQCVGLAESSDSVVVNSGDGIQITIPSKTEITGQTVTLNNLKANWFSYRGSIPPVLYPHDYVGGARDLFETDVMVNPYAKIPSSADNPRGIDSTIMLSTGDLSQSFIPQSRSQRDSNSAANDSNSVNRDLGDSIILSQSNTTSSDTEVDQNTQSISQVNITQEVSANSALTPPTQPVNLADTSVDQIQSPDTVDTVAGSNSTQLDNTTSVVEGSS